MKTMNLKKWLKSMLFFAAAVISYSPTSGQTLETVGIPISNVRVFFSAFQVCSYSALTSRIAPLSKQEADSAYFLELVKNNTITSSIINSGSFSILDEKKIQYTRWADGAIEIKHFELSEKEIFQSILILNSPLGLSFNFTAASDKYLIDSRKYFGKDAPLKEKKPYVLPDGRENRTTLKTFSGFLLLGREADITVLSSTTYGHSVLLNLEPTY
jgi:hypothetical protein